MSCSTDRRPARLRLGVEHAQVWAALERACGGGRPVAQPALLRHQLLHAVVVRTDDLLELVLPLLTRRYYAGRGREVGARLLRLEREADGRAVGRDLGELVSHVDLLWSSSRRRSYPVAAVSTIAYPGPGLAPAGAPRSHGRRTKRGGGQALRPPSAPSQARDALSAGSAVDGALPGADLLLLLVGLREPARGDALGLGEELHAVLAQHVRCRRRRSPCGRRTGRSTPAPGCRR